MLERGGERGDDVGLRLRVDLVMQRQHQASITHRFADRQATARPGVAVRRLQMRAHDAARSRYSLRAHCAHHRKLQIGARQPHHIALPVRARIRRLFLLDPTQCFAGYRPAYLLHALPLLLRPTPGRVRALLEWETGGAPLDPDSLRLQEAAAGFPSVAKPVAGPRPTPQALRGLDMPVLLLLAGNSRTHDTYEVAAKADALLPRAETVVVPDVSHHALPQSAPAELGRRLTEFLSP